MTPVPANVESLVLETLVNDAKERSETFVMERSFLREVISQSRAARVNHIILSETLTAASGTLATLKAKACKIAAQKQRDWLRRLSQDGFAKEHSRLEESAAIRRRVNAILKSIGEQKSTTEEDPAILESEIQSRKSAETAAREATAVSAARIASEQSRRLTAIQSQIKCLRHLKTIGRILKYAMAALSPAILACSGAFLTALHLPFLLIRILPEIFDGIIRIGTSDLTERPVTQELQNARNAETNAAKSLSALVAR